MACEGARSWQAQQSPCLPGPPTGGRARALVATACTRPIFYVNLAAVVSEIPGLSSAGRTTIHIQVWRNGARTRKICQLEHLDGITSRQSIKQPGGAKKKKFEWLLPGPSASAGAGGVVLGRQEEERGGEDAVQTVWL